MNPYKLNGQAVRHFTTAVCKGLGIHWTDIYKTVKNIDQHGVIETKDGKKYQVVLKEITKTIS